MATIRYKQGGNKWYVYEMHAYWDKKLRKPHQKTRYLGVRRNGAVLIISPLPPVAVRVEKATLDAGEAM